MFKILTQYLVVHYMFSSLRAAWYVCSRTCIAQNKANIYEFVLTIVVKHAEIERLDNRISVTKVSLDKFVVDPKENVPIVRGGDKQISYHFDCGDRWKERNFEICITEQFEIFVCFEVKEKICFVDPILFLWIMFVEFKEDDFRIKDFPFFL